VTCSLSLAFASLGEGPGTLGRSPTTAASSIFPLSECISSLPVLFASEQRKVASPCILRQASGLREEEQLFLCGRYKAWPLEITVKSHHSHQIRRYVCCWRLRAAPRFRTVRGRRFGPLQGLPCSSGVNVMAPPVQSVTCKCPIRESLLSTIPRLANQTWRFFSTDLSSDGRPSCYQGCLGLCCASSVVWHVPFAQQPGGVFERWTGVAPVCCALIRGVSSPNRNV
jgi:hypothetical protein